MKFKDAKIQLKREEAKKKAEMARRMLNKESYVLQDGKVFFTEGQYVGYSMDQLWLMGREQRDYVAAQVGSDPRPEIRKLFLQLLCK